MQHKTCIGGHLLVKICNFSLSSVSPTVAVYSQTRAASPVLDMSL